MKLGLSHQRLPAPLLFVSFPQLCFPLPPGRFAPSLPAQTSSCPLCWQACLRPPAPSSLLHRCHRPARNPAWSSSASKRQSKTSVLSWAELMQHSGKEKSDSDRPHHKPLTMHEKIS